MSLHPLRPIGFAVRARAAFAWPRLYAQAEPRAQHKIARECWGGEGDARAQVEGSGRRSKSTEPMIGVSHNASSAEVDSGARNAGKLLR